MALTARSARSAGWRRSSWLPWEAFGRCRKRSPDRYRLGSAKEQRRKIGREQVVSGTTRRRDFGDRAVHHQLSPMVRRRRDGRDRWRDDDRRIEELQPLGG